MVSPHDSQPVSTGSASSPAQAWALTLAVALATGLIAWACGEMMLVPEVAAGSKGAPVRTLPHVQATRNAIVSFAIFGAALGLGLGLAGGLIRRSVLWTVVAATMGLILGGLTGAGVSWATLPVYYQHLTANDLTYSLLVHGGTWTAIGAIAGLSFGLGRGGWGLLSRCLLGAVLAALLATLIYEFAGMMLFPTAMTDRPLSNTSDTRLLARLLVAVMVAAGALLSGSRVEDERRRERPETVAENLGGG